MAGGDAVLGARGSHADDFLCSEISGKERQPGYPSGHGTARGQKLGAGLHESLQAEADPYNKPQVDDHDQVINPLQLAGHAPLLQGAPPSLETHATRGPSHQRRQDGSRLSIASPPLPPVPRLNTPTNAD
jgi:hypothetical protein